MLIDNLFLKEWFVYNLSRFLSFTDCKSISSSFKDFLIPEHGWKKLCYRDFPKVNFKDLRVNKPFETYCICQNIGNYCVICKKEMWNDNNVGEHYLLMCNCLKTQSYCCAHKDCLTICSSMNNLLPNVFTQRTSNQRKKTLVTFKCIFCNENKKGLPIYVYS
tara:strand:+ start:1302 stop:1787 length:486 start_codon:yes stop_codon:yes gene_type:complete